MGNFLADVGRSQAIPQFLEQARLARKDEAGIAAESERLNLLKQESGRADESLGLERDAAIESRRITKAQNDEKIRQIDEGNKTLPWSSVSEMFPSKGVADFATKYFKAKGQLNEDGPESGVKSKHFDELSQKINPKSDKYDIAIATQVNGIHLNSVAQKKAYIQKAMEDPEAFKAFKAQFPEVKKPEDLQGMLEQVNQEYGQAFNSYHQITEKDKIMRQEAADKQIELTRHNKEVETALKSQANAANIRAGADVVKADAVTIKAGKKKPPTLSTSEYKNIKEDVTDYGDKSPADKAMLNELALQNGMVITKKKVPQTGFGKLKKGAFDDEYSVAPMSSFKTPEDVKVAFQSGTIDEASAAKILQTNFSDQFGE